jgi:hypothetical protein
VYHIAEWADIVNAHILPGPGIIEGLKQGVSLVKKNSNDRALLLLAQMSSKDNLLNGLLFDIVCSPCADWLQLLLSLL